MYDETNLIENTISDGFSTDGSDADKFVSVPGNPALLDFGLMSRELTNVSGVLPLPIRLVNGKHFGAGGGYGISHILYKHAAALALHQYRSVQDFVDEIAQGFSAVYAAREGRQLIVKRKDDQLKVDRLLVLEARNDHYAVITGWFVSARRPINGILVAEKIQKDGVMVWECRAPHSDGPGGSSSNA